MSVRRVGSEQSATRSAILDATETLMLEEGYGAVSTRAVAAKAGVKPALVQYYFPKMDDLWVAMSRRAGERFDVLEDEALASDDPAEALWRLTDDPRRTALGLEVMALANHRKALRGELRDYTIGARTRHAEALQRAFADKAAEEWQGRTLGVAFLINAIARSLVMERGVGLTCGHDEAISIVEEWLQQLKTPAAPARGAPRRRAGGRG
jgi:AcrR family transcriptional regulator